MLHCFLNRGFSNWIDIAKELKTDRTPYQCLARFQRSLNPSILNNEWTPTEDEELRKAVAEYGETNWQLVASVLSGRTGTQCSNRWKKSLNPLRERVGRWDSDEDKRLKIAVRLFGAKNWNKITKFVPGRTQVQCRERWVNCLDPSLKVDKWTGGGYEIKSCSCSSTAAFNFISSVGKNRPGRAKKVARTGKARKLVDDIYWTTMLSELDVNNQSEDWTQHSMKTKARATSLERRRGLLEQDNGEGIRNGDNCKVSTTNMKRWMQIVNLFPSQSEV
ncbi:Myb domain protein 4r1 [Tanacetum coccineum]|uniref:Myb domain protein 4r1 n=1 Tax=Tanacetum coccineum TaxID=301880 RepID=A0ABQ4Y990_9ASTR